MKTGLDARSGEATQRLYRAPGRVNLIGEHTDYNAGFVLPAAIRYETRVSAAPREDRLVKVRSAGFAGTRSFDLDRLRAGVEGDWSDHVRGMLIELRRAGTRLRGADVTIGSDVPIGAGLSSSASVMVAFGFAMLDLADAPIDRVELARVAQRAENEHAGARTGIMDPFVCANARAHDALLLDTRSLTFDYLPLPERAQIVICNTMVKHDHATGGYNERRKECETGTAVLADRFPQIRALRDATLEQLAAVRVELSDMVYRRCRHVITEDVRTLRAADALRAGDLRSFGTLMDASHASLRDDFEVSCSELDSMVNLAHRYAGGGVYGARMTGGGFGGCAIALVESGAVEGFVVSLRTRYREALGIEPEFYVGVGAAGASEVIA